MKTNPLNNIRIGTLAGKGAQTASYIQQILPHGFESFQINFWKNIPVDVNLKTLACEVNDVLAADGQGAVISALGLYGNPLVEKSTAKDWARLIDACELFRCDLVCGFAGRIVDQPIPDSMKQFKKVFRPLVKRAADRGVRLAFENCDMGGDWQRGNWNIANAPTAWEMIFHEVPDKNLGLEWEPCHQMVSLIDPLAQLRKWAPKVFHVHGKDATVDWVQLRATGLRGGKQWVWHRTPGFGDSNWTDIISILRMNGFTGAIDIEGWHDPVYQKELEMTGQVYALHYLKRCRGGAAFIPNPQ
jgi:sugar phosphate isomerase/epimerase